MEFELRYGRSALPVSINHGRFLGELSANHVPPIQEPSSAFKEAFLNPSSGAPLSSIVRHGENVLIILSDKSRTTHADVFLPVLLDFLNGAGVPDRDIALLFGGGLHPPMDMSDKVGIAGSEILCRVRHLEHKAIVSPVRTFGTTSFGNQVELNQAVDSFDRVIVTGAISHHYFAGFGGGRKGILPGIASKKTITYNHKLIFYGGGIRHPQVGPGQLEGNPVHLDMEEGASFLNPDFLINTVSDHDGNLISIFTGDWRDSFKVGCDFCSAIFSHPIQEKSDLVIASCGGYPNDINFVQAHKSIDNASRALKEGGIMILSAECKDGFSSPSYAEWFLKKETEIIQDDIVSEYSIPGQTVLSYFEKAKKFKLVLVTSFSSGDCRLMRSIKSDSLDDAVKLALSSLPPNFTYYVIPNGSAVLPVLKD